MGMGMPCLMVYVGRIGVGQGNFEKMRMVRREDIFFFSCEIMPNVLYVAQKSGYEAQAYIPSTQHEVAVWRCTRSILRKETSRFSLFFKKKNPRSGTHSSSTSKSNNSKKSSPEIPPPPHRTIHTTYCNQPQAMKRTSFTPPPTRRKTCQDAPNATVCSMKTSSIYSVEPRFETAAVTRKIFLSLSESLVVCVPTCMLLERFRSWSCVYRMGREGGGAVEEGS